MIFPGNKRRPIFIEAFATSVGIRTCLILLDGEPTKRKRNP